MLGKISNFQINIYPCLPGSWKTRTGSPNHLFIHLLEGLVVGKTQFRFSNLLEKIQSDYLLYKSKIKEKIAPALSNFRQCPWISELSWKDYKMKQADYNSFILLTKNSNSFIFFIIRYSDKLWHHQPLWQLRVVTQIISWEIYWILEQDQKRKFKQDWGHSWFKY